MGWKDQLFAFLLASVPLYYSLPGTLRYLGTAVGRLQIDPGKLVQWENSTALNNGDCTVDTIANACEDVKIHFPSSTAFLACGDPLERTKWYPPACRHDVSSRSEASFRENLFKHDIKTAETTELQIEGLDGDFVTHGIDIYQSKIDESKAGSSASVRHTRNIAKALLLHRFTSSPFATRAMETPLASSRTFSGQMS